MTIEPPKSRSAQLGIVMLCHGDLTRAAQVARHWARGGCPVAIHVDRATPKRVYQDFVAGLATAPNVQVFRRYRCDWGSWGLVAATQLASAALLDAHPSIRHVCLTSGACLPLRPVADLIHYLDAHRDTDFIESATTADVPWTVGGLDEERFRFYFPFSWRKQRRLFDRSVAWQRRLGFARRVPNGLVPHLGSQWWCLTRATLTAILSDPDRKRHDRYFKRVWIPDESYFQTLARRHSKTIESRSLTLSKFDFQGKPHVFYDDHLSLLRQSDCFLARKIWPGADGLYDAFLNAADAEVAPKPQRIDRVFARAKQQRTRGRAGLYMQSRFPNAGWENGVTAKPYAVFQGFTELFAGFDTWLAEATGMRVHGRLFAPERVEFAGGKTILPGALPANPHLRDANPQSFLTNLIWNMRHRRQCFQFHPNDVPDVLPFIAGDPNATVSVISGAWALPLADECSDVTAVREEAANLQKREAEILYLLRAPQTKARVHIWTMAEFLDAAAPRLRNLVKELAPDRADRVPVLPPTVDLTEFGGFLHRLKNTGMHPYLMGDFPFVRHEKTGPSSASVSKRAVGRS